MNKIWPNMSPKELVGTIQQNGKLSVLGSKHCPAGPENHLVYCSYDRGSWALYPIALEFSGFSMWLLRTETIYSHVAFSHAGADPPNWRLEGGPCRPPELSLGHSLLSGIVPYRFWAPGLLRYSFQSPQVKETTGLSLGSPSLHWGLDTRGKKNGAIIRLISYVTVSQGSLWFVSYTWSYFRFSGEGIIPSLLLHVS